MFVVRDETGVELVAGLAATLWGRVMEVEFLWVCEDRQGCGTGTRLMEAAEGVARERGCERMATQTYSFQAPGFYAKQGYREVGRVPNWTSFGHDKVIFVKDLA